MKGNTEDLIFRQAGEVQKRHPLLLLKPTAEGALVLEGGLGFEIQFESRTVQDDYQIRIQFPSNYPREPPLVFEVGCKVPQEFGHFMSTGDLCLGAPVEVRMRFDKHRNLLHFIETQVVFYLFSWSYYRDYGKMPFGELEHGDLGLLQFYSDYFGTERVQTVLLLKYLVDGKPVPRQCPCGSGARIDFCHGHKLEALRPHLYPGFAAEFDRIVRLVADSGESLHAGNVTGQIHERRSLARTARFAHHR